MQKPSNDIKDYNHVDLLFPSKYLKGVDLGGEPLVFTIRKVDPREELHRADNTKEYKPVVTFVETEKQWVMNKTNAERIADMYGSEVMDWYGKRIVLWTERVSAFGKTHDALRVKPELLRNQPDAVPTDHDIVEIMTGIEMAVTLDELEAVAERLKKLGLTGHAREQAGAAYLKRRDELG